MAPNSERDTGLGRSRVPGRVAGGNGAGTSLGLVGPELKLDTDWVSESSSDTKLLPLSSSNASEATTVFKDTFSLANLPHRRLSGQLQFLSFAPLVHTHTANPQAVVSHHLPPLQNFTQHFTQGSAPFPEKTSEKQHTCQQRPAPYGFLPFSADLVCFGSSAHSLGQGLLHCTCLDQQHPDTHTDSWIFKILIRQQTVLGADCLRILFPLMQLQPSRTPKTSLCMDHWHFTHTHCSPCSWLLLPEF